MGGWNWTQDAGYYVARSSLATYHGSRRSRVHKKDLCPRLRFIFSVQPTAGREAGFTLTDALPLQRESSAVQLSGSKCSPPTTTTISSRI